MQFLKRLSRLLAIGIAMLVGCTDRPRMPSEFDSRRQIYDLVLSDTEFFNRPDPVWIAGFRITAPQGDRLDSDLKKMKARMPELPDDLWADLRSKLNSAQTQNDIPVLQHQYVLVPGAFSDDPLYTASGWNELQRHLPGCARIEELSPIAFSDDGRFAALYLGFACGETCSGGAYEFVKYDDGRWRGYGEELKWVS